MSISRYPRHPIGTVASCLAALALAACGSPGSSDGTGGNGSGGSSATGGSSARGGSTGATGSSGTGGDVGTGGSTVGTGGKSGTGGSGTGTGGSGTGTGGAHATGGSTGTGGTSTGGVSGTGTGGSGTGGAKGGSTGTGGSSTGSGGSSTGSAGSGGSSTGSAGSSGGGDNDAGGPASAATSTIIGNGCTAPAQYENLFITALGQTQASSDTKITAAWNQLFNPSNANTIFYNGPKSGEAYVEDIADNDVRTEGMSYGMMIALQLNHQTEFDELWTFVKDYMWKSGNTIAWQVNTNGSVKGSGGAPDGDEWFAAALIFAHNRWGDTSGKYAYGTEAQKTLDLVRTTDFSSTYHLVRYYSGTDSNGTDASYMLPAFYQAYACFDTANAAFWNQALTTTRSWLKTAAGSTGNIGDQSSFAGATTNSSGDDKLRTIANFMSDWNFFQADSFEPTYASEYATWVTSNNNGSTAMLACNGLMGFGLPAAQGTPWVQKLWNVAIPTGTYRYYDGALYTIALLHVSGAFHLWY